MFDLDAPGLSILAGAFVASALGCAAPSSDGAGGPSGGEPPREVAAPTRSFHMRYVTELKGMPVGETVRLWVPIPSDDPHQTIQHLTVDAPWSHRATTEQVHRNRMLYFEGKVEAADVTLVVEYDVARAEIKTDLAAFASDGSDDTANWQRYVEPTRLVVIDDTLRDLSERLAPKGASTLRKARAYYDHVLKEMAYDKSGDGWGRGDSLYACSVGKGNCTDFHSYFKSLCMAAGIPARFQIGMWGSYEKKLNAEYESGSYHCWAEFRVPGRGWVPVDISEADKAPAMSDYFFGSHSDNRCTLSTGRDIVLAPAQEGMPLNYFVNPYAEINGEVFEGVSKTPYWTDLK